jgi:choline dehydrogenase-like flavoprotein
MGACIWPVHVVHIGEYITTLTVCLTITSRDSVTIASADPAGPQVIDVDFNATEAGRYILHELLKKTVSVIRETKSWKLFIEIRMYDITVLPNSPDEFLAKHIRDSSFSLDRYRGSCAMGKLVNSKYKARNVQGLCVVDASIFAILISVYPRVCVYATAQKDAEMCAQSTNHGTHDKPLAVFLGVIR